MQLFKMLEFYQTKPSNCGLLTLFRSSCGQCKLNNEDIIDCDALVNRKISNSPQVKLTNLSVLPLYEKLI